MLSGLLYWLSPARRRFMRRLGRPALARLQARLATAASGPAIEFISILLRANAEFLAFALFLDGPLARFAATVTPGQTEGCLKSMLIYSMVQFVRDEMFRDGTKLIGLLAEVAAMEPKQVMLRRDQLRKTPRSEEWMLYTWLVTDLGGERPVYGPQLERPFAYQYLSYIGQYRDSLVRAVGRLQS